MTTPVVDDKENIVGNPPPHDPEDDERKWFGTAESETDENPLPAFAINRSDFIRLLKGEELMYGPLRRMISIEDGPFDIVDDGTEPHKITPPEPIEFRNEPESSTIRYVYAQIEEEMERDDPTLNERIGNVLRSFADRVRDVFRGGAGSGHHAHAGRPGEVGGSAPSGVAVAEKPKYERVQHSIEEFRNAGGTLYRIDAGRERNVNAWRKEHQDILDRAMQEVEYYGSATGFNQELPGLHIAKHRRKFRRFYILPDGRLFLVRDHDEVAEHVVVESLLHFSAMDELKDATGQLGFGSPKDTMLTIGFVRGGFDVLNRDDDNPALHELDLQFDTPLTSEARRTIKDLMALEPERLWFDANGISGKSDSDLNRLVARTLEEKGGEGSGHHDHAGRPGEVGGSAPSGVAAIGEYDPDPRYEDYDTREGKRFRIDTDREHLIDQFRKDHPEYMSDAMDMIERYQPTRGFGAGERFVREAPALNLWEYGRSFGRFFIFPDGRFFLVKDHDEIGDTVSLDLQAKYGTLGRTMELQNENASVFGKKGLVTLGFIRGGWSQSNDPSPESLTHFSFQFETPVSSAARRTIKDLIVSLSNILDQQFYHEVYDQVQGKIQDAFIFTINGRNIKDLPEDPQLRDNDNISIFPPVGGGQQQWIQGSYMK